MSLPRTYGIAPDGYTATFARRDSVSDALPDRAAIRFVATKYAQDR